MERIHCRWLWLGAAVLPLALFAYTAYGHSWRPRTIKTYAVEPRVIQMSRDGRTLIFDDQDFYVCDLTSYTQRVIIPAYSAFFIENGKYLVASCRSEDPKAEGLKIFSMPKGKLVASGPKDFGPIGVLADESTIIGKMPSEDGRSKIFRWNWRSDRAPKLYRRLSKLNGGRLTLLADRTTLTDEDHFWDLRSGKLRFQFGLKNYDMWKQFSNSSSLMACTDRNKAQIWNYRTGKLQTTVDFGSFAGNVGSVKVSPDGALLAGVAWHITNGKSKHQINLWNVRNGRLIRQIEAPLSTSNDYRLAFSYDGRTLALAIAGAVKLWRIK